MAFGLRDAVTEGFDELLLPLLCGFAFASLLTAALPGGLGAAVLGGARGRAVMLALALPMQLCEHASVPVAVATWLWWFAWLTLLAAQ